MIDIDSWIKSFTAEVESVFGDRIWFIAYKAVTAEVRRPIQAI